MKNETFFINNFFPHFFRYLKITQAKNGIWIPWETKFLREENT